MRDTGTAGQRTAIALALLLVCWLTCVFHEVLSGVHSAKFWRSWAESWSWLKNLETTNAQRSRSFWGSMTFSSKQKHGQTLLRLSMQQHGKRMFFIVARNFHSHTSASFHLDLGKVTVMATQWHPICIQSSEQTGSPVLLARTCMYV